MVQEGLDLLNEKIREMDDILVEKVIKVGESFGERAMAQHKPRQEKVMAANESIFAIVGRVAYMKILDRLIAARNQKMAIFLRQIPFMQ